MKYAADDIAKLGTILGIWAHPDDECWMSAGIMAVAAAAGQRVVCATATNGGGGQVAKGLADTSTPLGLTRRRELAASLRILGVSECHLLGYEDGMLARTDPTKPTREIAAIIKEIKPRLILTFGADGFTGHMDHRTVYTWVRAALQRSAEPAALWVATEATEKYQTSGKILHTFANFYCNTPLPFTVSTHEIDVYFELSEVFLQKKIAALKAHRSQTHTIFADPTAVAALYAHAQSECFMKAV